MDLNNKLRKLKSCANSLVKPIAFLSVTSILFLSFFFLITFNVDTVEGQVCVAQCWSSCTQIPAPPSANCAPGNPYSCIGCYIAPGICVYSYSCGAWSECLSSGERLRTCTSTNCEFKSRVESEDCTPEVKCDPLILPEPTPQDCLDDDTEYLASGIVGVCFYAASCGDPLPLVNVIPTASLTADSALGYAPFHQVLFGISCADSDGLITSCNIDFGDSDAPDTLELANGLTSISETVGYVYSEERTYTATLTAIDDEGDQITRSVLITVEASEVSLSGDDIDSGSSSAGIQIGFPCPKEADTHEKCVELIQEGCAIPQECKDRCPIDTCTPPSYCTVPTTVITLYPDGADPDTVACPIQDSCSIGITSTIEDTDIPTPVSTACAPLLGCTQALGCDLSPSCTPAQCPAEDGCPRDPDCKLVVTTNDIEITLKDKDNGGHCGFSEECKSGICSDNICVGCTSDLQCLSGDATGLCDPVANECVPCSVDSDCSRTTNNCNLDTGNDIGQCVQCTKSSDCSETGLCTSGRCTECTSDLSCSADGFELNYPCVEPGIDETTGDPLPGPNKCQECSLLGFDCELPNGQCGIGGECGSCLSEDPAFACAVGQSCDPDTGTCGCANLGQSCTLQGDCCSGACSLAPDQLGGVELILTCSYCSSDSDCSEPTPICDTGGSGICKPIPLGCLSNSDCSEPTPICEVFSGICQSAKCPADFTCTYPKICENDLCVDELCDGIVCGSNQQCISDVCIDRCGSTICGSSQECIGEQCYDPACLPIGEPTETPIAPSDGEEHTSDCPAGEQCVGPVCKAVNCGGITCSEDQICVNDVCEDTACGGVICTDHQKCITNTCVNLCGEEICQTGLVCESDHCVQPPPPPPQPPTSQRTGGGASTASIISLTPVQIVRNVITKAAIPLIYSLFNVSRVKTQTSQECIRGAQCGDSADCCGAPCFAGSCTCSTTACTTSADCCTGYCDSGQCQLPPETSLFLDRAAARGFNTQIGCAGLIQECDASETNCISICNGLTFLLALTAGGAGAFVWRRYKHPVPGFAAALVPLIVGLATYPFVGIIIGVMLFSILLSRR